MEDHHIFFIARLLINVMDACNAAQMPRRNVISPRMMHWGGWAEAREYLHSPLHSRERYRYPEPRKIVYSVYPPSSHLFFSTKKSLKVFTPRTRVFLLYLHCRLPRFIKTSGKFQPSSFVYTGLLFSNEDSWKLSTRGLSGTSKSFLFV